MIKNGQKADETSFNTAFVSRTTDTSTTGKVTLANNADANSGATVTNTQRAINETFDAVGMTGEGDASRKQYSSNNYIAQGDSHKTALGKLDAQAFAQTTAPVQSSQVQGPIPASQISGTVQISQGGTGQTTKSAAFDALSPSTTKGDVSVNSGTTNVRLPVGSDAQVLTADSTTATGVKWATVSAANPNVSNATGTLPIANGGTGQTTKAAAFDALSPSTTSGDLIVRGASTNQRLAIGSTNQVLTTTASGLAWVQPSATTLSGAVPIANGGTGQTTKTAGFDALSPLTTKGDLQAFNGTSNVRVSVGTNGQVLQADSTNAAGVSWIALSSVSVCATYWLTSAFSAAANAPIKFDTMKEDTHSAYSTSTGLWTVPAGLGGRFRITSSLNVSTSGGGLSCYVQVSGTGMGVLNYFTAANATFGGGLTFRATAGQTVGIYGNTTATYNGTNGAAVGPNNQFTIERTNN